MNLEKEVQKYMESKNKSVITASAYQAEAKKTAKLNGSNVQVIATQNLIATSDAAHVLQGGFVHVHESNSKIIPPSLKEFISKIQK